MYRIELEMGRHVCLGCGLAQWPVERGGKGDGELATAD